jgi:hypothetical protein
MKKVINKLALVALALFVTVGVVSCGCDDKEGKTTDKPEVKLVINKTLTKDFNKAVGDLTDTDVTFEVEVELLKGVITEELAKKIKVDAPGFKENNETLDKVGVTKLESGKGTIKLHFYGDKKDVKELNTLIAATDASDQATVTAAVAAVVAGGNPVEKALAAAAKARKDLSKDHTIKLSGDVTANSDQKLTVALTPQAA